MRINEIVESAEDQSAALMIEKRIRALTNILATFDSKIAAHGYEQSASLATEALANIENDDWYLQFLLAESSNVKIKRYIGRLTKLKQQVKDKIESGL